MRTTKQAALICKEGQAPQLLGVSANGSVNGRLLTMALQQRYRNAGSTNVEIVYTFALPFGAVLMEVEVDLNGKALQGVVSAKAQARERYEAALSEGNSGVMLERHKDGSYTLEIGNLLA